VKLIGSAFDAKNLEHAYESFRPLFPEVPITKDPVRHRYLGCRPLAIRKFPDTDQRMDLAVMSEKIDGWAK